MASLSSAGIGSGLDVASLVAQLVAAERQPADARLAAAESKANLKISALGTLRAVMAGLQTASAALSGGALGRLAAQSSHTELFTASAGDTVAGRYSVEVVALAQPHKLVTGAYASADTALGAGSVEIGVGSESFTVGLTEGADTLAHLRDAINAAPGNRGVSAILVNEAGGTRLLLTAERAGSGSSLSVTSPLLAFGEKQAAQDAHVRIEGYDHYADGNTISGAIDGLTLTLLKAEPGTIAQLDVAADSAGATSAIEDFVRAYNTAIAAISTLTRYDAGKREAAALTGDALARSSAATLRGILGGAVDAGDGFGHLSEIGITSGADGTLKLDNAKLSAALQTDAASVQQLFAGPGGYASRLDTALDVFLDSEGQIAAKQAALTAQIDGIDRQQAQLDERMARLTLRYRAQFTALDTLIAQMNSTSSYLSQQLAGLSNLNGKG